MKLRPPRSNRTCTLLSYTDALPIEAVRRIARTRSAAGDADDGVVVVDLDVEAVGAEVHRHRLPRLDHAQRAGCARGGLGFGDSGFVGVLADELGRAHV